MNIFAIAKNKRLVKMGGVIAAGMIVYIAALAYNDAFLNLVQEERMAQTPLQILQWERGMLEAEVGQRGYLLTDRKEYLHSYNRASRQVEESLSFLDRHFEEVPEAKNVLEQFHKLSESRLSELLQAIRFQEEGQTPAALDVTVWNDLENAQIEKIKTLSEELRGKEALRMGVEHSKLYRTQLMGQILLALLFALNIWVLFLYWRKNESFLNLQEQLKRNVLSRSERHAVETEVAQRTAALSKLTHHLQTAREDERQRIARDLHDELGALLISAKLDASRAQSRWGETTPESLGLLAHLIETLNQCFTLKQRIIEGLHPTSLVQLGLVATLENLAREFSEHTGIQMHCDLAPVKLATATELVIYRAVQESFTNIGKYAQAHNVWLTLKLRHGFAHVSVRDDGIGFQASTPPPGSAHGLVAMRFRIEAEGGSFAVKSTPGHGTLIQASLPMSLNRALSSQPQHTPPTPPLPNPG